MIPKTQVNSLIRICRWIHLSKICFPCLACTCTVKSASSLVSRVFKHFQDYLRHVAVISLTAAAVIMACSLRGTYYVRVRKVSEYVSMSLYYLVWVVRLWQATNRKEQLYHKITETLNKSWATHSSYTLEQDTRQTTKREHVHTRQVNSGRFRC